MLYLFDKLGKRIGYIKTSQISFCFDNLGRQIGKICQSGNSLYLYNNRNKLLARFDTVLGLKIEEESNKIQEEIPQEILDLVEQRKQARENKDWSKSDELRDIIQNKGYQVKDTKDGMQITK